MQLRYAHGIPAHPQYILGNKLVGYVDAEDNARITASGGVVSAYADVISGSSYAQATTASRPITAANAVTGRQVLRFDGVDDCLEFTGIPTGIPTGANPGEIIAIVTQSAPLTDATGRRLVTYGGTTSPTIRALQRGGTNTAQITVGNGSAGVTVTHTPDLSGNHMIRLIVDGTTVYVSQDGVVSDGSACVPGTTTTRLRIGANTAGTAASFWWGDISALLFTNAVLTSAEYNAIATWARPRTTG